MEEYKSTVYFSMDRLMNYPLLVLVKITPSSNQIMAALHEDGLQDLGIGRNAI